MTAGLLFHCHHSEYLAEWTDCAEERFEYVERNKSKDEVELRFALFAFVPAEDLPEGIRRACAELDKAYAEWHKVNAEWNKACAEWDKACAEWDKAYAEWLKACAEWRKACAEWAEKNHKRLCHPNCPWDGETIFAKGTSVAALAGERAIGCMFNELPKR